MVLAGLASDGGLYVPESLPTYSEADWRAMRALSYPELALQLMWPFVEGSMPRETFARMVHDAYSGFRHAAIAPVKQLGSDRWLLELFHGPTLVTGIMGPHELWHLAVLSGLSMHWRFVYQFAAGPNC